LGRGRAEGAPEFREFFADASVVEVLRRVRQKQVLKETYGEFKKNKPEKPAGNQNRGRGDSSFWPQGAWAAERGWGWGLARRTRGRPQAYLKTSRIFCRLDARGAARCKPLGCWRGRGEAGGQKGAGEKDDV